MSKMFTFVEKISWTSWPVLTVYANQPTKGGSHAIEYHLQDRTQYYISDIGKRPVVDLNADKATGRRGHHEYRSVVNVLCHCRDRQRLPG